MPRKRTDCHGSVGCPRALIKYPETGQNKAIINSADSPLRVTASRGKQPIPNHLIRGETVTRKMKLIRSTRGSLSAVGEFAYEDALRSVPNGEVTFELILEPDNPYDHRAISVRYNGRVVAYIPRDKTRNYWQPIAKVTASGYIPTVDGHHDKPSGNVELYLPSGTASLPSPYFKNMKAVKASDLPNTYGRTSSPVIRGSDKTQEKITQNRNSSSPNSTGCGTTAAVALAILILPALILL